MNFLLLSIGVLTIFEPVLASTAAATGGANQPATTTVFVAAPQTEVVPLNLDLYGGQNGHKIFAAASKDVITRLVDDLAEIPFYRLRCYAQRKTWFLGFLEELGVKRKEIARRTKSTGANEYGQLRSSIPEKPMTPFGNSSVSEYPVLHDRVLAFFHAKGIRDKVGDFAIQISPHTQIQGKNLSITSLEVTNDLTEKFDLFIHDRVTQSELLLDVVQRSLADRSSFREYTVARDILGLRIAILQEYININGFQVPGRSFGMFYYPSETDAEASRKAPLSLCHPFLFPHFKAGPRVREKKGDHLLDETMTYFFKALQEPRDFHAAIAKFIYHFAITMPYVRGSAAIGEWIYQALCLFHNIRPIVPQVFSHLDQLTQSSFTFDEFWVEYQKLVV